VDAATVRKIIQEETTRADAKQRALEPPKNKARDPHTFRGKDPARWDALVIQGRDDYRASLRARGIEPHAETCAHCKPRPTPTPAR
jgi:hypothetical protein